MSGTLWNKPLQLGAYTLKNRVVLAAMTRTRANPKTGIPTDLFVEYYGQRAGAGLMLTECAAWSPRGISYPGNGEIFNKEQAEAWRKVTDKIHQKGGLIYMQIYHGGRATHPALNGGHEPWAPSAVALRGEKISELGNADYPTPKEMTPKDIETTLAEFEDSLKLVKSANFDGIEIHGANGHLVDQFLRSHTNRREGPYGGSPENRVRFALELVDIALKYFQPYQVGIKLSPTSRFHDMFDEKPLETFSCLLEQLSKRNIGFVELSQSSSKEGGPCSDYFVSGKEQIEDVVKTLRPFFKGLVVANNEFTPETGLQKMEEGSCDAVSFARLYITNPDLEERILKHLPLNTDYDYSTFYGPNL